MLSEIAIRYEHYNPNSNCDHFVDYSPFKGLLDTHYLEALFLNDREVIDEVEEEAALANAGPLSDCCTVANFSSIKIHCCMIIFSFHSYFITNKYWY